jgi:hypothetical protein
MSTKSKTVTDLSGDVRYFPQGPFAFGDPICSLSARIRIDEPAETKRVDGQRILYQRYHLFNADQIPHDRVQTGDVKEIKHYVDELREVLREYPDRMGQLTVLEENASSVTVHGEVSTEYEEQNEMRVTQLPPRRRWQVKQQLRNGQS